MTSTIWSNCSPRAEANVMLHAVTTASIGDPIRSPRTAMTTSTSPDTRPWWLAIMAEIYEAPAIAALGPVWSAVISGFAVLSWDGEAFITPAGEMYLASLEN